MRREPTISASISHLRHIVAAALTFTVTTPSAAQPVEQTPPDDQHGPQPPAAATIAPPPAPAQVPPGSTPPAGRPAGYGTPEQHGFAPASAAPMVIPPEPEAGRHLHDGFYLHVAMGAGSLYGTLEGTSSLRPVVSTSSVAAQLDVAVGTTPWPGVVLGGRFAAKTSTVINVLAGEDKYRQDSSLMQTTLQAMTDIYPWPTDGIHFLGGLGIGTLTLQPSSYAETYRKPFNLTGLVGTLGLGWQGWIARQWSMGGLLTFDLGSYLESNQTFVYGAAPDEKLEDIGGRTFSVLMSFETTFH